MKPEGRFGSQVPAGVGNARSGRGLCAALLLVFLFKGMAENPPTSWQALVPPVPPLEIPADIAQWQEKRAGIRSMLQQLLGHFPERPEHPKVTILSRTRESGYWREKFVFDDGIGGTVPGYLLTPLTDGPHPAVLYCHWHGGEYGIGKEEIFQTNHTPVVPGPTLAGQGYVVLAIDAPCFGERNGQGPDRESGSAGEASAAKFNLWIGRTLWGWMLRDDLMALDYLASRPEVDAHRLGVTGISMGATRTWWLMALDDRLKVGVAVACLTRYQDLIAAGGLKHHGIYYYLPGLLEHFDTEAVVACIAPRPILFLTGEVDGGSPASGVREIERTAAPVWDLYRSPTNFVSRLYPGLGHVYTPEMWSSMVEWMGRHLAPGRKP